jgi:hypothetical protein
MPCAYLDLPFIVTLHNVRSKPRVPESWRLHATLVRIGGGPGRSKTPARASFLEAGSRVVPVLALVWLLASARLDVRLVER